MSARLSYLHLLRASTELFKRDAFALRSARAELRKAFEARRLESDLETAKKFLAEAVEAEEFMRHNLVQAKRTARGSFAVELKPDKVTNEFAPVHPDALLAAAANAKKKTSSSCRDFVIDTPKS